MTVPAIPLLLGTVLAMAATAACASASGPDEQARVFATCSGRLSAIAAYRRGNPLASEVDYDRLRAEFDLLLDAAVPIGGDGRWAIAPQKLKRWKASGWREIAYLLPRRAREPAATAAATDDLRLRIADCRSILLS